MPRTISVSEQFPEVQSPYLTPEEELCPQFTAYAMHLVCVILVLEDGRYGFGSVSDPGK